MFGKFIFSKSALKAGTITGAFVTGQVLSRGVAEMRMSQAVMLNLNVVPSSSKSNDTMGTIDKISADLFNTPQDEVLVTIQSVSKNEATAVAMTLGSDPAALDSIMPGNSFTLEEKGNLLEKATEISQRPDLVKQLQSDIQHFDQALIHMGAPAALDNLDFALLQQSSEGTLPLPPSVPAKTEKKSAFRPQTVYVPTLDEVTWGDLTAKNGCTICSDLLAAPVILGCQHSFCGICVHNHTHAEEGGKIDAFACPNCRVMNTTGSEIYEHIHDNAIVADVQKAFPKASSVKEDWEQRRSDYFALKMKKALPTSTAELQAFVDNQVAMERQELEELRIIHLALFTLACAIMVGVHVTFRSGESSK